MKNITELNEITAKTALGGAKIPHGISNPVLRNVGGIVRVCYFVYTYDKEAMQSGNYRRPTEWIALDITEGNVIGRFDCAEVDFTTMPFDAMYSMNDDSVVKPDESYFATMDQLFDIARASLIHGNKLDETAYSGYMNKLFAITPEKYRVFYKDLSNVH